MRKGMVSLLLISIAIIFSGCVSAEETIYQSLEGVVKKEKDFEDQQAPLAKLEAAEKNLFDEIMALGMKEFNQITQKADEALKNLDEREELMKKEKEALDAAKQEFNTVVKEMDKIKGDKLQKQAKELQTLMENRYESYDKIFTAYNQGLEEDRKIYQLLKNEDLKLEELEEQIQLVNDTFATVMEANDEFNEQTEIFNEAKLNFYKAAGINVEATK
ncbi:YkyA family protein [Bacillus sp. FJAT-50079]|uniref:YkyA family protein n=1 Tax=Bacillus sp. FJAT-50079 TaxID=2833577 RepID=UPI001BC93FC6|nr:YkyA family protein [Bacillus sp. FJAT-50079]MBS4207776.1 YkyA family protein [Bacillus sp. FJAT-50079]